MSDNGTLPTEAKATPPTKRPYHPPKLEDHGSVSGLTQSTTIKPNGLDGQTSYT